MQFEKEVKIRYEEGYLPTKRHRKLRYRTVEGAAKIKLNMIKKHEAPVAFIVNEYGNNNVKIRLWNQKFWIPLAWHERVCGKYGKYPVEEFIKSLNYERPYSANEQAKDSVINYKQEYANRHLIIDGVVYGLSAEPRYVVQTFGLGNNHGGTSLFVSYGYNSNISKDRYFNALQRDLAVAEGKRVATARGDTEDIDRIGERCNIKALIPEVVKCNPQEEHGEGCAFINKINNITEKAPDSTSAGFMALFALADELKDS